MKAKTPGARTQGHFRVFEMTVGGRGKEKNMTSSRKNGGRRNLGWEDE